VEEEEEEEEKEEEDALKERGEEVNGRGVGAAPQVELGEVGQSEEVTCSVESPAAPPAPRPALALLLPPPIPPPCTGDDRAVDGEDAADDVAVRAARREAAVEPSAFNDSYCRANDCTSSTNLPGDQA
jgi:hypothetical protein